MADGEAVKKLIEEIADEVKKIKTEAAKSKTPEKPTENTSFQVENMFKVDPPDLSKMENQFADTSKLMAEQNTSLLERLGQLIEQVKQSKVVIPPFPEFPEFPKFPEIKEIRVTNLRDVVIPRFDALILSPIKDKLTTLSNLVEKISQFKLPRSADDPISVRLSDGKEFYKSITQLFGNSGGGGTPTVTTSTGQTAVPVTSLDDPTIDSYTHTPINLAPGADQLLVASSPGKQIWVYGVAFTTNAEGSVSFQDEDDTAISGVMKIATNSGLGLPPSGNFRMPIWKLATNKDLEVDVITSEIDGWLDYAIISV